MSTITLEQVESLATEIHNSPSTSVSGTHISLSAVKIAQIYNALCGYATLLRERESAKAGVSDDDVCDAMTVMFGNHWKPHTDEYSRMRAVLEDFAPMLASAQVPDEVFEALRSVFHAGWNIDQFRVSCHKDLDILRDWMLAAAPKRGEG